MKKQIITIAGKPGSGKSTTTKLVSSLLNYKNYSSGKFMREIAKKHKVTLNEISLMAEKDTTIDKDVDKYVRDLNSKDKIVVDSRLAFHWIPNSFKVYLDLDLEIAARRIYEHVNKERLSTEPLAESATAYEKQITERLESEKRRYLKYYNLNPYDLAHFDIVIDTAEHTPESIAKLIVDSYKSWMV